METVIKVIENVKSERVPDKIILHYGNPEDSKITVEHEGQEWHFVNYEHLMEWKHFSLNDVDDVMAAVGIDKETRESILTTLQFPGPSSDQGKQEFLDFIRSREGTV